MELKIAPKSRFPDRGPCVQLWGDWVTEAVWQEVARLMGDNFTTSPVYQARSKSSAFFQGGYNDPKGKWILLEFWSTEEKIQDFLKMLNEEVNKVIKPEFTAIRIVADEKIPALVVAEICGDIAGDTGCRIELGNDAATAIFHPEDNLVYDAVLTQVMGLQLTVLPWEEETKE